MATSLTRVRNLVVTRVDLVDVGASLDKRTGEGAHVLLFKRAGTAGRGGEGGTMAIDVTKLPKDVQEYLAALEKRATDADKRATDAETKLRAAPSPPEPAPDASIWKSVHPAAREQFEHQKAKAEEAERFAKAQRDARLKGEYIQKCGTFSGLPVKPDDDWAVFKAVDEKLGTPEAKRIWELLRAADEAMVKAGLFREIGVPGTRVEADSAEARIMRRADELVAKKESKTREQAVVQVAKADPALYEAYREELRARGPRR